MYLVRTEFSARAVGAGAIETNTARLGEMRRGQPGYLGQTLLRSYSYPDKYVGTSRFENVEAAWAFTTSDVLANYRKSLPPGPSAITQQEGYESVFEVDADGAAPGGGDCEVLVDWVLDQRPNVAAEFERTRREFFELRKKHVKGFSSNRLRRSAGIPSRYLALNIYKTVAGARAAGSAPEVQAYQAAHPYSLYAAAPPSIETYHVIHRMPGS
jgi:heme-degrading monooxygenase HmoA